MYNGFNSSCQNKNRKRFAIDPYSYDDDDDDDYYY